MTHQTDDADRRTRALVAAVKSGLATKVVALVVAVGCQPLIVRFLGVDRYGAYATITSISAVASFADLGIGNGIISELSRLRARKDLAGVHALVSSAQAFLLVIGAVVSLAGVASLAAPWQVLFHSHVPTWELRTAAAIFIVLFGIGIPLSIGQKLLLAELRGDLANTWLAAATVAGTLTALVASLAGASLPVLVLASQGMYVAVNGLLMVWLTRTRPEYRPSRSLVSRQTIVRLISKGAVFLVVGVAGTISYELDLIIVSSQLNTAAAGRLAVCVRVFTVVLQLGSSALAQLWATFAHAIEQDDLAWVRRTLWRSMGAVAVVGAVVIGTGVVLAPWGIRLLFGAHAVAGTLTIALVGLWVWQQCVNMPLVYLLTGSEAFRFMTVVVPLFGIADLAVSLWLVHPLGTAGPVAANLITHTTLNLIPSLIWVRHRLYRSPAKQRPASERDLA